MKSIWLVILAASFYLFIAILFWPIERQMLPNQGVVTAPDGYQRQTVQFSDSHVRVRVPTTRALQEKGLGGISQLSDEEGMLWYYDPPQRVTFWMKGMLIPLDFIWIRAHQVVQLTENVLPPDDQTTTNLPIIDPGVPIDAVLEVPGGFIQRHQVNIGDVLSTE